MLMRLTEFFCLHVVRRRFSHFSSFFFCVYEIEVEHSRNDLSRIFCDDCLDMFWSMVTFDHQSMVCHLANSCSLISWKWVSASPFILLFDDSIWMWIMGNVVLQSHTRNFFKALQRQNKKTRYDAALMVSISCENFRVPRNLKNQFSVGWILQRNDDESWLSVLHKSQVSGCFEYLRQINGEKKCNT